MSGKTCETCRHNGYIQRHDHAVVSTCIRCADKANRRDRRPLWQPLVDVDELEELVAALRAGLEWLREEGADVSQSGETDNDGAPIWRVYAIPLGLQDRAEFYRNLAAAAGHPALAQLGAEGAETTNDTNGSG